MAVAGGTAGGSAAGPVPNVDFSGPAPVPDAVPDPEFAGLSRFVEQCRRRVAESWAPARSSPESSSSGSDVSDEHSELRHDPRRHLEDLRASLAAHERASGPSRARRRRSPGGAPAARAALGPSRQRKRATQLLTPRPAMTRGSKFFLMDPRVREQKRSQRSRLRRAESAQALRLRAAGEAAKTRRTPKSSAGVFTFDVPVRSRSGAPSVSRAGSVHSQWWADAERGDELSDLGSSCLATKDESSLSLHPSSSAGSISVGGRTRRSRRRRRRKKERPVATEAAALPTMHEVSEAIAHPHLMDPRWFAAPGVRSRLRDTGDEDDGMDADDWLALLARHRRSERKLHVHVWGSPGVEVDFATPPENYYEKFFQGSLVVDGSEEAGEDEVPASAKLGMFVRMKGMFKRHANRMKQSAEAAEARKESRSVTDMVDAIDSDRLRRLRIAFRKQTKSTGVEIGFPGFVSIVTQVIDHSLTMSTLEEAFARVDTNAKGCVSWDQLTSFLLRPAVMQDDQEMPTFAPGEDTAMRLRFLSKEQAAHRDVINALLPLPAIPSSKIGPRLLSLGRDGTFGVWDARELSLQRRIRVHSKPISITCGTVLPSSQKIALATLNSALLFYDPVTLKCTSIANSLVLHNCISAMTAETFESRKDCVILGEYGGSVSILTLDNSGISPWHVCPGRSLKAAGGDQGIHMHKDGSVAEAASAELLGASTSIEHGGFGTVNCDHFVDSCENVTICTIEGVHDDFVSQVQYVETLGGLLSSSLDGTIKLLDIHVATGGVARNARAHVSGDATVGMAESTVVAHATHGKRTLPAQGSVVRVFSGHKRGVNCFVVIGYRCVVSAGLDRDLLVWDPRSFEILRRLTGHETTVMQLVYCQESSMLLSLGTNKVIRIWNVETWDCVQQIRDHTQYFPVDRFSSFSYDEERRWIVAGTTRLHLWRSRDEEHKNTRQSHSGPLVCALYSKVYDQVVSVDFGSPETGLKSSVRVWNMATSELSFAFLVPFQATSMTLDASQRRIVLGDHSGGLSVWLISTGECVMRFMDQGKPAKLPMRRALPSAPRRTARSSKYSKQRRGHSAAQVGRRVGATLAARPVRAMPLFQRSGDSMQSITSGVGIARNGHPQPRPPTRSMGASLSSRGRAARRVVFSRPVSRQMRESLRSTSGAREMVQTPRGEGLRERTRPQSAPAGERRRSTPRTHWNQRRMSATSRRGDSVDELASSTTGDDEDDAAELATTGREPHDESDGSETAGPCSRHMKPGAGTQEAHLLEMRRNRNDMEVCAVAVMVAKRGFDGDGEEASAFVVSSGWDRLVRVWAIGDAHAKTRSPVMVLNDKPTWHFDDIVCLVVLGSISKPILYTGSLDGSVVMWNLRSGQPLHRFFPDHLRQRRLQIVGRLQSPAVNFLVNLTHGGHGSAPKVLTAREKKMKAYKPLSFRQRRASLAATVGEVAREAIVVGYETGALAIYSTHTCKLLTSCRVLEGSDEILCGAVGHRSGILYVGHASGLITAWDVSPGRLVPGGLRKVREWQTQGALRSLAIAERGGHSPRGDDVSEDLIISCSADACIRAWTSLGRAVGAFLPGRLSRKHHWRL